MSVAIAEIVVTAIFVLIVLGTTDEAGVPKGFGPIAAGLGLALVWALGQVWAFIVFPLIGAALAAGLWLALGPQPSKVATPAE